MHDARMLAVSGLYDDLENFAFCPAGTETCLYGDPAYPVLKYVLSVSQKYMLLKQ